MKAASINNMKTNMNNSGNQNNNQKYHLYGYAIFLLAIISLVFLIGCEKETAKTPVKEPIVLGALLPLTGGSAIAAEYSKQGYDLALAEINKKGGINGRLVAIDYEDTECKAEKAVSAAQKLITQDRVSVLLGPVCSSDAMAVAPIAEKNKMVMLVSVASTPKLKMAGDYIFRNRNSGEKDSYVMAEYARNTLQADTAAIFYINLDNGVGYMKSFKERFEKLGGEIAAAESYEKESRDYRTQLTKIKASNPDVLYLAGQEDQGLIIKQVRELGITVPLLGPVTMQNDEILQDAGEAAEGIVFSSPFDPAINENMRAFDEKFRKAFGKTADAHAAHSYDMLKILALVMKKCEDNPLCIKNELYTVQGYDGVVGETSFDSFGEVNRPLYLKTVREGRFMLLEE